ncbi:MAG: phosphate acyltransferase PlsX [Candidatus Neomarinimicrobiota bacterium]
MNFVLDAMGGDNAPNAVVQGALKAIAVLPNDVDLTLIGDKDSITQEFNGSIPGRITIQHTTQTVDMHDSGVTVIKKKPDSPIVQGIRLVKDGKADGFISAGHTGAVITAATLLLGRIPNVKRPALAAYIQSEAGGKVLCDVGANPDAKPEHLLQFAIMASYYLEFVEKQKNPKIGLINIGEESTKGSELYINGYKLLKKELANFYGNVEGRHLLDSEANVLICDGFVGNTILKFGEGWMNVFYNSLKSGIASSLRYKLGGMLVKPIFNKIKKKYDYEEHGGTPLLGVNGIALVCHGSSGPKSFLNSILLAKKSIDNKLIEYTKTELAAHLEAYK